MDTKTHNTNLDALEALIDQHGLPAVVSLLAEICSAKADHVRENWQDEPLAEQWDKRAAVLLNAEFKVEKIKVF